MGCQAMKTSLTVAVASAGLLLSAAPAPAEMLDSPVEIYVGANPGGGYDRMARALQGMLEGENMIDQSINISYHPGGGGAVAWAKVNRNPGDMTKLSIFSPNIVTNDVLGASPQTFKDFTMVSTLVFEDGCFAVNPKGDIDSADRLIKALTENPQELKFGFAVAAGNQWHVTMAKFADAVGADITKVRSTVLSSGGKARAALLGQHTDVSVSGCASFAKQHEGGELKIVAVASKQRQQAPLDDVPTWQELGYDVVWGAWRGVLGPKGMSEEQIAFWEDKLENAVTSKAWEPIAAKNYWRTEFLDNEETLELLERDRKQYQKTLKMLGLID